MKYFKDKIKVALKKQNPFKKFSTLFSPKKTIIYSKIPPNNTKIFSKIKKILKN
jgi:hypothetical protein